MTTCNDSFEELDNLIEKLVRNSFGKMADEMDSKEKTCIAISILLDAYGRTSGELDTFLSVYNILVEKEFGLEKAQNKDEEIETLKCKLDTYERALKALGSRVN